MLYFNLLSKFLWVTAGHRADRCHTLCETASLCSEVFEHTCSPPQGMVFAVAHRSQHQGWPGSVGDKMWFLRAFTFHCFKTSDMLGAVVHAFNLSTQEAEYSTVVDLWKCKAILIHIVNYRTVRTTQWDSGMNKHTNQPQKQDASYFPYTNSKFIFNWTIRPLVFEIQDVLKCILCPILFSGL